MKNKIVGSLQEVDYRGIFPLAVVYNKPSDFPTAYVVRIWDVNRPTNIVFVARMQKRYKGSGIYCVV